MKFKLTEEVDFSTLDGEFYKDGANLFYYDGNELQLVPPRIASKILIHASLAQREADASKDPKYDPYDMTDYRNRLKQANTTIKQKELLKPFKDKPEDDLSKIAAAERRKKLSKLSKVDPIEIKNAPMYDELSSNIRHFLVTNYGKPEKAKGWTGTNPMQLDPDAASQEIQRKPNKGKIPTVLVYFDRSLSWDDANKTRIGWNIIANFAAWEKAKKINVIIRYFGNVVSDREDNVGCSSKMSVENVINDIKTYAPDNVVIVTDSDSSEEHMLNQSASVALPGATWIISVDSIADGLEKHIHSAKEGQTLKYFFKVR